MKNEFSGKVSGVYRINGCVLCRCDNKGKFVNVFSCGEVMHSYYGKGECVALSKELASSFLSNVRLLGAYAEPVCDCTVIRVFGVGLSGGGILCRALKELGNASVFPLGVSASECGLAFALCTEQSERAFDVLSRFMDE